MIRYQKAKGCNRQLPSNFTFPTVRFEIIIKETRCLKNEYRI